MSIRRLSIAARQSVKRVAYSVSPCHNTDLNKLSERLVEVVQETMQPAYVSLWLKDFSARTQRDKDAKAI